MKIAISARGLSVPSGGAREYILKLVERFPIAANKHEVVIFYDKKHFLNSSKQPNVREIYIPRLKLGPLGIIIWDNIQIPLALFRNKVDLTIFPKLTLPFIFPGKSIVSVMDMGYFYPGLNAYKGFDTLYMKMMVPRSLRKANAVNVISRYTRDDILRLIKGIDPQKVQVTYLAGMPFKDELNLDVREKFGLGTEPFIFFSGSLSPRKNVQGVLQALALIKDEIPHNFVVTGGKSWNDSDIPELVEKLGLSERFVKLGYVERADLPYLYKEADMYLHPTLFEGFGMTVLEAFAAGTPVITSNITSIPEVAGDAAILVDPYNIDEIAAAIINLVNNDSLKQQLVQKGQLQLQRFSWDKMAKEVLAIAEGTYED